MSVLRKFLAVIRRDRRRNNDVTEEVVTDRDTVQVIQPGRSRGLHSAHLSKWHSVARD